MAETPPAIEASISLISKIPDDTYCLSSNRIDANVTIKIISLGNRVGRINSNKEKPKT